MLGGQAVNPYGTGRNPSGSSSGSAVAVAAGLAPLAVGTETDGSIVSPSHCCGIVGIKPTVGLVSRTGIVPVSLAQDTAGPMTRCVADAAILLGALAGADPADEATAQAAAQPADYAQFLDARALAGARIGVWRGSAAEATAATAAVLDAVVSLLRASGAAIIDPVAGPG
jgi:amidase